MTNNKQPGSTQKVFEAVQELRSLDQAATREAVARITGLKLSIVDDRLRVLANEGRIRRLVRGVYEIAVTFPPARPVSMTVTPDGMAVISVGDEQLTLNPREARMLGWLIPRPDLHLLIEEACNRKIREGSKP